MNVLEKNKIIEAGNFIKSVSEYYRFNLLCEEINNLGNKVVAIFEGYYYEIFDNVSDISIVKANEACLICWKRGDKVVFL